MIIFIIFLAKYLIIFPVIFFLLVLFKNKIQKNIDLIVLGIFIFPIAFLISIFIKHFVYDPRPFVVDGMPPLISHAADNGFPSNHTLLAAVIASVIYLKYKKSGLILMAIALIIGISRITTGLHHPVDIIASILIAVIAAGIGNFLANNPILSKKIAGRPHLIGNKK